jgi:hypothetical protein
VPGRAADVDPVVGIGGVAEDPLVLLVERVHRAPRQRDLAFQELRVGGECDVLPGAASRPAGDLEPGGLTELGVRAAVVGRLECPVGEIGDREVGHGVAARLEEQDGVIAAHHGHPIELGTHPAPQRLRVEQALGDARDEEAPVGVVAERPLLP